MTIAPDSVTYIARRASPTARRTPDIAMPSAIGTFAGMVMARKIEATRCGSPLRMQDRDQAPVAKGEHQRGDERGDDRRDRRTPRRRACGPAVGACAERPRHRRRNGDGEADVDRHGEEGREADIADRRLERLIAEPRHPEQRQEIDGEDRHQSDRPGRGHHRDMAHQRPLREHGQSLVAGGVGSVQGVPFLPRGPDFYRPAASEARGEPRRLILDRGFFLERTIARSHSDAVH